VLPTVPVLFTVSVVPHPCKGTEQGSLVVECVVDSIDEEILPFVRTKQERESPRHNLLLDPELLVAVEQAVMALQVDAGCVLPFWWCAGHAEFVIVLEKSCKDIQVLRV
jgi:hypothetical protein